MEYTIDIFAELHSILQTRLPDSWDFVKLKDDEDLSVLLNDITYFTGYICFLFWFVKLFISRVDSTIGRPLGVKDKCLISMMSMVTAMHGIWPFFLFFTHFLTCSYYPWTTATIILFLNIYFIATSSRWLCSNVYSKILAFLCFIKNLFSLEWLSFAPERVPTETSEENDIRPSATPVIQPRLAMVEDYRQSKAPVIQTKLKYDEVPGPSHAPVIQPRIGTEESYRPSAVPSIQPQLIPEKPHGSSETPVIQPKIDGTALNKASKIPVIQPRFNTSETPKMQSEIGSTQPYGILKAHKIQPRTLQFDEGFSEDSTAGSSKGSTWYSRVSGESESSGGTKDEYSRNYLEFKKFQEDDQVGYEDFNQELDSKKMKTSTPKRNTANISN